MGGRGAKSGAGGPAAAAPQPTPAPKPQPKPTPKKSTVDQLNDDYKANASNVNQLSPFGSSNNTELGDLRGVYQEGYNGRVMKMALSPTARCITYSDLMKKWNKLPQSMKNSLTKQGNSNVGSNYHNKGQAQLALKLGYNVVTNVNGYDYHYGLTRDAFIVCGTIKHKW